MPEYRWQIVVRRLNHYGDKIVVEIPMTLLAANKAEVTTKVREAFEATYDDFRKFWSHTWHLVRVDEEPTPKETPDAQ